jgi:DNA-binding MarR family transcriptional regulator/GNAT superfamily N-acetyltransferase
MSTTNGANHAVLEAQAPVTSSRQALTPDLVIQRANEIRAFNRFYTQKIGVLQEGYLETPYPLTVMRLVFELGDRGEAIAADLARDLNLDQGYLSRLVARLKRDGMVAAHPAARDRRQFVLSLTAAGQAMFERANQQSQDDFVGLLQTMPDGDQRALVDSLRKAGALLGAPDRTSPPMIVLREHQPGDMGWILEAHGAIYAREYGFDARFEALAAEVVSQFLRTFDAARERCWIAERDGERVGCVAVVRASDDVAKLRILLVDPRVRGQGLGRTLVRECIRFARATGYRTMVLWTVDILEGARRIYESEGFRLVDQERFDGFGPTLTSQHWELAL